MLAGCAPGHRLDVDLDVLAAGAIVDSLSRSFDAYWNSDAAMPASALPVSVRTLQALPIEQHL